MASSWSVGLAPGARRTLVQGGRQLPASCSSTSSCCRAEGDSQRVEARLQRHPTRTMAWLLEPMGPRRRRLCSLPRAVRARRPRPRPSGAARPGLGGGRVCAGVTCARRRWRARLAGRGGGGSAASHPRSSLGSASRGPREGASPGTPGPGTPGPGSGRGAPGPVTRWQRPHRTIAHLPGQGAGARVTQRKHGETFQPEPTAGRGDSGAEAPGRARLSGLAGARVLAALAAPSGAVAGAISKSFQEVSGPRRRPASCWSPAPSGAPPPARRVPSRGAPAAVRPRGPRPRASFVWLRRAGLRRVEWSSGRPDWRLLLRDRSHDTGRLRQDGSRLGGVTRFHLGVCNCGRPASERRRSQDSGTEHQKSRSQPWFRLTASGF
ncbi:collagen alpha-1(I) chain-like [Cavia porcellus]|uniref:collagen alpha-1(I) chain-like n=1 Tax=Cavia porcellus TaxID=10141 RepID=UPI002FE11D56